MKKSSHEVFGVILVSAISGIFASTLFDNIWLKILALLVTSFILGYCGYNLVSYLEKRNINDN